MMGIYKNKIDLIYIDPPYNTNRIFKSSLNRNNTISSEEDGEVAYSDNLTQEEYFEFIRERLFLLRELLSEEGSIYLHIDYKIGHYIKIIMDEIFGIENFKNDISRIKSNPKNFGRKAYGNQKDMILFYAKNSNKNIFNNITIPLTNEEIVERFNKIDKDGRRYTTVPVHAPGETKDGETGGLWKGMYPPKGRHWRYSPDKLTELDEKGLIEWSKTGNPRIKNFADEHKGKMVQDIWEYKDPTYPVYPTEKDEDLLKFIIRQSSNKDSIVLDCFSGSGTTLKAASELGRRFIGIDNSDIAIEATKKKLEDANYNFLDIENGEEIKILTNTQLKMI
ncbi:MAG: site-specific DNA-methyltransferase [Tissierellia bacterium]|nr:site-specific DNA-methyltransferase [Tissierellia bacterium]